MTNQQNKWTRGVDFNPQFIFPSSVWTVETNITKYENF